MDAVGADEELEQEPEGEQARLQPQTPLGAGEEDDRITSAQVQPLFDALSEASDDELQQERLEEDVQQQEKQLQEAMATLPIGTRAERRDKRREAKTAQPEHNAFAEYEQDEEYR
jgi:ABC-type oligopeptide transport system substrate-binding subunit